MQHDTLCGSPTTESELDWNGMADRVLAGEPLSAEEALSNAPEHLEGFFTVPTVVELTLREGSREEG